LNKTVCQQRLLRKAQVHFSKIQINENMENKKKKNWVGFAIGIVVGLILYKLIFDVFWPYLI